ncbi:piggyBac transposable element-derived protein 4 [Biomphalaria glabrata]|nr:piggyBac transposable element-derived protein 4 [Biomphalaria glabrata]
MIFINFFAAINAMGINQRPALNDFFSTIDLFYTPFFGEFFNRDRFLILFSTMVHSGEANAEGKNKVEPFINKVIEKFNIAFTPHQQVSIDEMIVGFKGRWQYKLFNPYKPSKYHIKSFGLVDSSTGYVINLLTYYGKNTSFDPEADTEGGQAIHIFYTLLKY